MATDTQRKNSGSTNSLREGGPSTPRLSLLPSSLQLGNRPSARGSDVSQVAGSSDSRTFIKLPNSGLDGKCPRSPAIWTPQCWPGAPTTGEPFYVACAVTGWALISCSLNPLIKAGNHVQFIHPFTAGPYKIYHVLMVRGLGLWCSFLLLGFGLVHSPSLICKMGT